MYMLQMLLMKIYLTWNIAISKIFYLFKLFIIIFSFNFFFLPFLTIFLLSLLLTLLI